MIFIFWKFTLRSNSEKSWTHKTRTQFSLLASQNVQKYETYKQFLFHSCSFHRKVKNERTMPLLILSPSVLM